MITRICVETNSQDIEVYIGGDNNFRKEIYPEYKSNRTKPPPTYLQDCREILVTQYGATVVNGVETDDALGIAQTKYDGNSRICSLDKDLLQIPGYHYNWVKQMQTLVSPLDGLRTFYKQLVLGDRTDNIPGYDGKLRSEAPKFIQKLQEPIDEMIQEEDMWDYVAYNVYGADDLNIYNIVVRNAQLLYILKREDEFWKVPSG